MNYFKTNKDIKIELSQNPKDVFNGGSSVVTFNNVDFFIEYGYLIVEKHGETDSVISIFPLNTIKKYKYYDHVSE